VPPALVERAFATAAAFFDLPQCEKERSSPEHGAAARGYHRLGSKNLAKTLGYDNPPDLREQFYIGPLEDRSGAYARFPEAGFLYAPNIWPVRPPGYRAVFSEYYRTFESLARQMMRLFAVALDMPESFFDQRIDRHFSTVPANDYPALAEPALPGQLRCGEHTDFGSLTILAIDGNASGLEVRARDGRWNPVTVSADQFVVNI
jgi:isopenicillin N synthase-like dioxygenase